VTDDAPKFILDRELFPLCKALRMLGFDALSRGDMALETAIERAIEERRIWVRRDMDTPSLQYGVRYFMVHSDDEADQLQELQFQYSISRYAKPFSRCLKCNLTLVEAEREAVVGRVPEKILASFEQFYICPECERVYWPGSHLQRMKKKLLAWGWKGL